MISPSTTPDQQLRDMNEALLVSSVRQHELTELALKEQWAIAKALAYSEDIIATLREPFLVLDAELRVKSANRSFYDSFHVLKVETENCFLFDLGNRQWDIPALRKLLEEVLSRIRPIHDYEVEHTFPILGTRTMLLNARPFPPDSKHPELILLAIYDISAARQQANDLAELHRRKDEFLAMLSHELRNPLAPIANAVHVLRLQKHEDDVQQQARTIIERQVGQLTRLVDDLLEISRITTGRVQLHRDRVALSGIVEHAVETVRPLIDERRHKLTMTQPPQPIWLYADAARLQQVVVNLLRNAAKYTDAGGHISLTVQQEGDEAVLRVLNSGIGIVPELLPRIFDLFTQAERSLDRSQGGLGIGLALVQRLVEMHGGRVDVSSAVGHGSEFVVRVPVVVSTASQPPAIHTETTALTGRSLRVLVVDDNVDAAQTMAMLLKTWHHQVSTVHDGPAAMKAALEFQPNLMLLDIGLPMLDGYEVAKQIRREPGMKNVVLVAVTGYGQESDRQRTLHAGFDHHLVKPPDYQKLQEILASVTEKAT